MKITPFQPGSGTTSCSTSEPTVGASSLPNHAAGTIRGAVSSWPRECSAKTLPDRTELRGKRRNPAGHKVLRVQQALVIIGVPEGFDPPNLHPTFGYFADLGNAGLK